MQLAIDSPEMRTLASACPPLEEEAAAGFELALEQAQASALPLRAAIGAAQAGALSLTAVTQAACSLSALPGRTAASLATVDALHNAVSAAQLQLAHLEEQLVAEKTRRGLKTRWDQSQFGGQN